MLKLNRKIVLHDVTLRDGNHALRHSLTRDFAKQYCEIADKSSVDYIEIGHGNGIGASCALVGFSAETDQVLLETAREALKNKKLSVHCIPGFATVERDVSPAVDMGVDLFRIASHVTEADTTAKHLEYVRSAGKKAVAVLMMTDMASVNRLVEECKKAESYGGESIVIMDSAGHFTPRDVTERIGAITSEVGVGIGFHAHNNLGVGIANDLAAVQAGATTLDASSMALGAGAGNAQLECLAPVLSKEFGVDGEKYDFDAFIEMSALVEFQASQYLPRTTGSSVVSGLAGVFSGYAPQVKNISESLNIEPHVLWRELGERKVVAGQESIIWEIARDLMDLT